MSCLSVRQRSESPPLFLTIRTIIREPHEHKFVKAAGSQAVAAICHLFFYTPSTLVQDARSSLFVSLTLDNEPHICDNERVLVSMRAMAVPRCERPHTPPPMILAFQYFVLCPSSGLIVCSFSKPLCTRTMYRFTTGFESLGSVSDPAIISPCHLPETCHALTLTFRDSASGPSYTQCYFQHWCQMSCIRNRLK